MSALLADIDATCASLGFYDGQIYHTESDTLQGLKHLIWILRRDGESHEYRRHLGHGKVLQTDLLPMLMYQTPDNNTDAVDDYAEMSDVLLRLMVNLTNPTILLYREEQPRDGPGRRVYLELIEILQKYKEAYSLQPIWAALGKRLQTVLHIDWSERNEDQGLLIERTLVLIRNVLQIPANPELERRADNDASLHDQVLWALQQAGITDLILYLIGSEYENQYHLHALEIVSLMFREQSAASLADASLQRSAAEKLRDEQELVAARRRERAKFTARPPPGRHSRFGGTYVFRNVKSISDNDLICHKPLPHAVTMDFNSEKMKQKRSYRVAKEEATIERRSAFSVRLFLREFCIEILSAAYNNLIRHVRRIVERNSSGNDDSYLLWAIRFFMEFNRLSGFQLQLVSESLSTQCFHWVLTRIQHHTDMMGSDKKNARLWGKRLHIAIQAFKELMLTLIALQKVQDDDGRALYKMLLNNVCYVLEFRETVLHAIMNYNEAHSTRAYLRDVVELTNVFLKIMETFCKGKIVVQGKAKRIQSKKGKKVKKSSKSKSSQQATGKPVKNLEDIWTTIAPQLCVVLEHEITLPEQDHPIPFDAVSDKPMDEQKDDCMIKIHSLLMGGKFEHAIILMRSARDVWPENDCFGPSNATPEDEFLLTREIFMANLSSVKSSGDDLSVIDGTYNNDDNDIDVDRRLGKKVNNDDNANGKNNDGSDVVEDEDDTDDDNDEEEDDEGTATEITESDFRFEDFERRLINPRIVRACTMVLADWEKITTLTLKSAVTILHRIAFGCKVPAMLFQASLFRIFQGVFNSIREAHTDELRRLAIYIVRKFIEIAPGNPKIFTELLFYKTLREANEIEFGYDGAIHGDTHSKGAWTEEQEDELRQLFMENQSNPATDMDVIDWIMDNLIEKNRTRRGIIKKLKELGLIFKAPTKKSTAAAVSKHAWHQHQDEQLRELYDQYRTEKDCIKRIMAIVGVENRSKNAVINRMISLGLIADRSEVMQPRKMKQSTLQMIEQSTDSMDNDESDDDDGENDSADRTNQIQTTKRIKKKISIKKPSTKSKSKTDDQQRSIDAGLIKTLIGEMNDSLKEQLAWIEESLNDAADDIEDEPSDDPDDGIPLVPINAAQRDAIENVNFRFFLISLGFQAPNEETGTYWKIPINFNENDLKLRARLLAIGDEDVDDVSKLNPEVINSDSEPELISVEEPTDEPDEDDEDKAISKNRHNLIYNSSDDDDESIDRSTFKGASKKSDATVKKIDIFDMLKDENTSNVERNQRFAQLVDSDDDDDNDNDESNNATKLSTSKNHRGNMQRIESDSSDGEKEEADGIQNERETNSNPSNANAQDVGTIGGKKRERSDADESNTDDDDEIVNFKNSNKKVRRRVAVINDDDDD